VGQRWYGRLPTPLHLFQLAKIKLRRSSASFSTVITSTGRLLSALEVSRAGEAALLRRRTPSALRSPTGASLLRQPRMICILRRSSSARQTTIRAPSAFVPRFGKSTATVSAPPKPPVLQTPVDLDHVEVVIRVALHELKADIGEQLIVERTADGINVRGVVENADRLRQIADRLGAIPCTHLAVNSADSVDTKLTEPTGAPVFSGGMLRPTALADLARREVPSGPSARGIRGTRSDVGKGDFAAHRCIATIRGAIPGSRLAEALCRRCWRPG
jgi:hypothetical protein